MPQQKIQEWRESLRPLDDASVELFLSKFTSTPDIATTDHEVTPAANTDHEVTAAATTDHEVTAAATTQHGTVGTPRSRFSASGSQVARLFEIAVKTANFCPSVAVDPDDSFGIPKNLAKWYEEAHDAAANNANDAVSDTSAGNGWEYNDNDIMGMVAPLDFEFGDSVLDVGCGDGFFMERILRVLPQLQVSLC